MTDGESPIKVGWPNSAGRRRVEWRSTGQLIGWISGSHRRWSGVSADGRRFDGFRQQAALVDALVQEASAGSPP